MSELGCRIARRLALVGAAWVLIACGTAPVRAPVEARSTPAAARPVAIGSGAVGGRASPAVPALSTTSAAEASGSSAPGGARVPAGAENAGKPGYYTVKPGDTLIRIGLDQGQNWRDVARWNGVENPNLIEVGQVLRVQPPDAAAAAARPAPAIDVARQAVRPESAGSAPPAPAPVAVPAPAANDESMEWLWPAAGAVVASFDEPRGVKGLAIAGKAGDPIVAAADGRVVYAGSGLRGYGNLVIVKHNNTFLTAYAHNQTLLVKEDQVVRRGQKIAEMGSTDADRVKLHFEIRRQGRPVDPARLLPAR
jgi:lipoprotein NlpD